MDLSPVDTFLGGAAKAIAAVVILFVLWFYFSINMWVFYFIGGIAAGLIGLYVVIAVHHSYIRSA
ncbi:hypothetical protein OB955_06815 [Halobacteria archaeon AArc-m2/3/4]|uniref:Major facilitator superfamily (MFS) profile domain-containing protein n=1 Tax=Natronoglomus mannanivorans TaxID=2979990 RepID=A0ABT2QBZ5_9EURY|nr:hypothetical protein [Halobacteria archaeon AArc-m2/3/4]